MSFISNTRQYLIQIGLVIVTLALTIWIADFLVGSITSGAVVIGAIASTAFILFISPHSRSASFRHVSGGHFVSLMAALPFAVFADSVTGILLSTYIGIAVGLAILLMALINVEHPPAAGTAFAIVAHGVSPTLIFFVVLAIAELMLVHRILKRWMIDLY